MAVYLDDSRKAQGVYVLATMLADTDDELRAAARAIGLDSSWICDEPDLRAYVSPGLGVRALKFAKAIPITAEQSQAMRWHRHHFGELGEPAAALALFNQSKRDTP